MKIISNVQKMGEIGNNRLSNALAPIMLAMNGSHVIGTLYSPNIPASSLIEGSNTKGSYIGEDSLILYDRIESMVFLGADDLIANCSYTDEAGSTVEKTGQLLIFGGLTQVREDSFFTLDLIDKPYLFRITGYTENTLSNTPVVSIDYELHSTDKNTLEQINNQIKDEYIMSVNANGITGSMIVSKKKYFTMKDMCQEYAQVADFYRRIFFDKKIGVFACNLGNSGLLVDYVLMQFMYDNRLICFDPIITFYNDDGKRRFGQKYETLFIDKPFVDEKGSFNTPYKLIEGNYRRNMEMAYKPERFDLSKEICKNYDKGTNIVKSYMKDSKSEGYVDEMFTSEFVSKLLNGELYGETDDVSNKDLKNALISFIKGESPDLSNLEIEISDSLEHYYLIPMILYVYKRTISQLE